MPKKRKLKSLLYNQSFRRNQKGLLMKTRQLGTYENKDTSKRYSVVKIIHQTPFNGKLIDGSYEFKTDKGIDLNSLDDDLTSFEIVQTGETIFKID